MKKAHQGSITIFSLLSMLLIAATLLSLLEGARYWEIKRLSKLQTESALESAFANYSTNLWNEYHLLGCTQGELQEILLQHANGRYALEEERMNTLIFQVGKVNLQSYTLLTDGRGDAFVDAVSSYMEDNLLYETAKEIYSRYEAVKDLKESSDLDLSNIEDALESIEEAAEDSSRTTTSISQTKETENPLEAIRDLLGSGALSLTLEDPNEVSDEALDMEQSVSKRSLAEGKNPSYAESGWWEKVLLQQYVLTYMSNYCDAKENHFLEYEVEYLIGGTSSDRKNLQMVVSELLLVREVANFMYLCSDKTKVAAAGAMAIVLVGLSANPALIEAVKIGLLTAWAYAESVLDVRALLHGKRIPLIKSDESWTLSLDKLGSVIDCNIMAEDSKWGLSYRDYLGILLLFQSENTIALRAMDVQEATLRETYDNPEFRMDELILNAEVELIYIYTPIFNALDKNFLKGEQNYEVSTSANFGYN